jgi:hypothetical protein
MGNLERDQVGMRKSKGGYHPRIICSSGGSTAAGALPPLDRLKRLDAVAFEVPHRMAFTVSEPTERARRTESTGEAECCVSR